MAVCSHAESSRKADGDEVNYLQAIEESQDRSERLHRAVRRFIRLLETVEGSDSGTVFHPVTINCCRSSMIKDVEQTLDDMKKYSK